MFVFRFFLALLRVAAQITAKMFVRAGIRTFLREETTPNKILGHEHWDYLKEHAFQLNFEPKTVETETQYRRKPETQVHRMTDSKVFPSYYRNEFLKVYEGKEGGGVAD